MKVYSYFSQVNAGSENLQLFLSVNIESESYNHFSQTKLIKHSKAKTSSQENWMVKSQSAISEVKSLSTLRTKRLVSYQVRQVHEKQGQF